MAKNKQKTSTQLQTTKKLDLCDQRKVERFVASEFDVSRQYLKKIRKEHPERKNVLEETEIASLYSVATTHGSVKSDRSSQRCASLTGRLLPMQT